MPKLIEDLILTEYLKREKRKTLPAITSRIARVLRNTKPEKTDTDYHLLLEQWENDCDMVFCAIREHYAINDPITDDIENEFFEILEK